QRKHTNGEGYSSKIPQTTLLLISIQGELQHKIIKRRFARTNKRNYGSQLAAADLRERFMRRVAQRLADRARRLQVRDCRMRRRKRAHAEAVETDAAQLSATSTCYNMAETTKERENILEWTHTNHTNFATKVCHVSYE